MNIKLITTSVLAGIALTACGGNGGVEEPVVGSNASAASSNPVATDTCVIDLASELNDSIDCTNGRIIVVADERSRWNKRLMRVESPKDWPIVAEFEDKYADVFVPLHKGTNRFDTLSGTTYSDLQLKDQIRDTRAGEMAGKINSLYFQPTRDGEIAIYRTAHRSSEGKLLLFYVGDRDNSSTQHDASEQNRAQSDQESGELSVVSSEPAAADTCIVDLTSQISDSIDCTKGQIIVVGDLRSSWNKRIMRVESPEGWPIIAGFADKYADVFVPLRQGTTRFDGFAGTTYPDLQLKDRLRETDAGELSGKIDSLYFQPTQDGEIVIYRTAQRSSDGKLLLIYVSDRAHDPVEEDNREERTDGDQI